ncbi:inosine-uridine preferring nucleoside hydrolase-like [Anneissia japonica]|uniref:inosine-uridine preferring nucleoside hydrolase-like n=1 Tax=Anneissia japonica TaxID=1529436 RepID=UPI00142575DF|nr:inosine-uridine preferring nucleoside hydrolase-like [Anneissia japonica]
MTDQVHMIIDCDVGVDDAQAIMLALAMPNVELVAITCVAGNVDVDKVCTNTLKVLEVCDRLDIPVYKGATSAILGSIERAEYYHGEDGLGEVDGIPEPDLTMIKEEVAAIALVRMVNEMPGQISIAAIGPLTNIAIAMKLDPNFTRKLKELVIMGGDLEGRAAAFLTSEFNFTCDPEAVHIVLSGSQCPVDVLPYEVCRNYGFTYDFFNGLVTRDNKKAKFIKDISASSLEMDEFETGLHTPCDLYAIAYLVNKSCVTRRDHVHVQVELQGSLTRGKMVTDWNNKVSQNHSINVIMEMDMDKLKIMFAEAM